MKTINETPEQIEENDHFDDEMIKVPDKNRLLYVIEEDNSIPVDRMRVFYELGKLFCTNLKQNLSKTSIDLSSEYGYQADIWRDFLAYPSIKVYLDGFRNEAIEQLANKSLIEGNGIRDAINVKKQMEETNKTDNSRFVVMMLPMRDNNG